MPFRISSEQTSRRLACSAQLLASCLLATRLPKYACLKKNGEWQLGMNAGECLRIGGYWRPKRRLGEAI
jgi:hypothetical protein